MAQTGTFSANAPTMENMGEIRDNQLYRGIVVKRYFVDDEMNVTTMAPNPQVLYDVAILGGFNEGQTVTNVRLASWLGGQYNYAERVLKPISKPLEEVPLRDQDGDIVFFQYVQGQKLAPIIVGTGTQPLDGDATGATVETGPRWIEQYNGVETSINKNGEYSLTVKGGELDAELNSFTPNDIATNNLSSITMTMDKKVTIASPQGPSVELDGTADGITIRTNNGDMISLASSTVTIENSGGVKITLSASGIVIDGGTTATVNADTINLAAGMVNVGQGAAFSATIFENLKAAFEGHIHQVPQAMAGILPSQPPLQPLIPNVGSNSVKISE